MNVSSMLVVLLFAVVLSTQAQIQRTSRQQNVVQRRVTKDGRLLPFPVPLPMPLPLPLPLPFPVPLSLPGLSSFPSLSSLSSFPKLPAKVDCSYASGYFEQLLCKIPAPQPPPPMTYHHTPAHTYPPATTTPMPYHHYPTQAPHGYTKQVIYLPPLPFPHGIFQTLAGLKPQAPPPSYHSPPSSYH